MLEKKKIDDFSENKDLGRRLYEYKNLSDYRIKDFSTAEIDWPFTVHGFAFTINSTII